MKINIYYRYLYIFTVFFIVTIIGEYLIYILFNSLDIYLFQYLKYFFIVLGIILPSLLVTSIFYGDKHFSKINSYFYRAGAIWFGFINYLSIATLIIAILIIINSSYNYDLPIKLISLSLFSLSLIITAYGIYNANNPKIVRVDLISPILRTKWGNKKIVMVSDIHLGMVRGEKFLNKIVDLINNENPDITFNLGDIIDSSSFDYQQVFSPLSNLQSKLGNYYVEGNHEGYSLEYLKFRSHFPKNLTDLTGKKIIVNDTQIIGLPYHRSRKESLIKKELDLVAYDCGVPSIILLHSPINTKILANHGVSLVLSGHTHGGQFFPFTIILKLLLGKYFYGKACTKETLSITSCGAGTALTPIRVGTKPEIVVISIK